MAREVRKVSVDVPTELYEKLALIAKAEQRSMSNLMVYILSTVADDYSGKPSKQEAQLVVSATKSGALPDWYTSANDPKLLGFKSSAAER